MADTAFFRDLHKRSSTRYYGKLEGHDRKRRLKHAQHAVVLLNSLRLDDVAGDIRAANTAEIQGSISGVGWDPRSPDPDKPIISHIITALEHVENYIKQQVSRRAEGKDVTLIDGRGRSLISDSLNSLFHQMKEFYRSVERGEITPEGELIIPRSGSVKDVPNLGPAVVDRFLDKTLDLDFDG